MAMNVNKINQSNNFRTRLTAPRIEREYSALQIGNTVSGTGDMGNLYPIHFQELIPGQRIQMTQDIAVQFMPFVSNLFHEINGEILNYFVPYRLLMDNKYEDWENFITGGVDGQDATPLPTINAETVRRNGQLEGTLWDYFGLPTKFHQPALGNVGEEVLAFPFRAYNLIWNEHIRIPDFTDKAELDDLQIKKANWSWDYFTRARIFQQRGLTPTVPLSNEDGTLAQLTHEFQSGAWNYNEWNAEDYPDNGLYTGQSWYNDENIIVNTATNNERREKDTLQGYGREQIPPNELNNPAGYLRLMPHNLDKFGINLNDLLQSLGIMRFQVNNAKIEARYIDHLKVRWGVFPEDSRLQRPEYLGSYDFNVMTEIVTQTTPGGEGQTKQGNITGQAWASGRGNRTEYEAKEHGIIISLMTIRPKTVYEGGIERYWSKKTKFDFPTPELMNMPDRPILMKELKFSANNELDNKTFGYQGIYEEYRTAVNRVVGLLRPSRDQGLASYTLTRYFESPPELNTDFIQCNPDKSRILQYPEEPTFLFFSRTDIKEAIALPIQSEPAELTNM